LAPIWIAVFLLAVETGPLNAQEPSTESPINAQASAIWEEAESDADLIFTSLPPIDDKTRNNILRYNMAARGWWVGMRCKFSEPADTSKFEHNLTLFTNWMDVLFAGELHKSLQQGNFYSQMVQRYALETMSAKKFYDCTAKAKAAWAIGQNEAERATIALQNAADHLNQLKAQQNK
jgi:hypothetical protein